MFDKYNISIEKTFCLKAQFLVYERELIPTFKS